MDDWLENTMDSMDFSGVTVTLSRRQTLLALTQCNIEIEIRDGCTHSWTFPFIVYNGARLELDRTDLKDDVATTECTYRTAGEWRAFYLQKAATGMGARIRDGLFSVIDSYSDG